MIALAFQILVAWLLADLATGVVHWFEDRYLSKDSFDFLSIAADNQVHHERPTAMLQFSYWENMRYGALFGWPLAALCWWLGAPLWLWLTPFFAAFGNLVHRFAHTPTRQLGAFVRFMQWTGLFIDFSHHDSHHRSMRRLIPKHEAGFRFCPMTTWVNPVVDTVKLWPFLEGVLAFVGVRPLEGTK